MTVKKNYINLLGNSSKICIGALVTLHWWLLAPIIFIDHPLAPQPKNHGHNSQGRIKGITAYSLLLAFKKN